MNQQYLKEFFKENKETLINHGVNDVDELRNEIEYIIEQFYEFEYGINISTPDLFSKRRTKEKSKDLDNDYTLKI